MNVQITLVMLVLRFRFDIDIDDASGGAIVRHITHISYYPIAFKVCVVFVV